MKLFRTIVVPAVSIVLAGIVSCAGSSDNGVTKRINSAPTANAGTDQNVSTGALITLDGSASLDADGDTLTYSWSFTSRPGGSAATLSDASVVKPTFTADVDGDYVVSLVVNDGQVTSAADTVTVTASTAGVGGPGPVSAEGKPATVPDFAALSLYSAQSPLNTPINENPAIDPNNEQLIAGLVAGGDFLITVKKFSTPVYFASETTPTFDVTVTCGPEWGLGISHLAGVPIPEYAEPAYDGDEGDGYPTGCGEGPDQDNHMVVLDLKTRCEYDFWQARKTENGWQASWASSISMDGNGIYPTGMSTRGSGFAFLGGVIWPDELKNGRIDHALAFNYPFTKAGGPVPPATDSDGITAGDDKLPEGALLQLNPELELDALSLTAYERAIAVALQVYGMYLADDGSSGVGLYAIDPKSVQGNPYEGILPDEDWPLLSNIPLDEFRVIEMGPQDSGFQDKLAPHESGCGAYVNK